MYNTVNNVNKINIDRLITIFKTYKKNAYSFNGEAHDFWECLYVIDGDVSVCADDRIYNLTSGEMVFHKPLEFHKFSTVSDNGATILIFSYKLSGDLSSFFENRVIKLSDYQNKLFYELIEYMELHYNKEFSTEPDITDYIYIGSNEFTYMQTIISYLHLIFLSIYENSEVLDTQTSSSSLIFKEAIKFMNENVSQSLTIDEIAKFCHISTSKLKRIFLKYTGINVHKYFMTLKLNLSTELLSQGVSVTETAEQLGFSSQGYFSKLYKKVFKINPSEVNKAVLN